MVAQDSAHTRRSLFLTLLPMTEQQRGRRALEVGPTGRIVAQNLARLRDRRGLTTRQLAGALERAGRPIPASGITRMEKAERGVTTDELVALSVVLGVSPAALLLPLKDSEDEMVEVTGAGEVPADTAWAWASNERPLRIPEGTDARTVALEYQLYSLPPGRATRAITIGGHKFARLGTAYETEAAQPLTYVKGGVRYDASTGKPIEERDDG